MVIAAQLQTFKISIFKIFEIPITLLNLRKAVM